MLAVAYKKAGGGSRLMEKQIITGLMAIMIGLAGWNLKTTHDLSITVSNMQS
jgi:hypothetical protein